MRHKIKKNQKDETKTHKKKRERKELREGKKRLKQWEKECRRK